MPQADDRRDASGEKFMDQSIQTSVLDVRDFGTAFGTRVVLADLDFQLAPGSITVLLGPAGGGKSTLLRSLAGLNSANPRYREWGEVLYEGAPLCDDHRPRLVQQHAKHMRAPALEVLVEPMRATASPALSPIEWRKWAQELAQRMGFPELGTALDTPTMDLPLVQQRAVAILAEASAKPALLMVDEPTADLEDYDAYLLLELLREVAKDSTVLVVLHNQRQANQVAQRMMLLAGGRIQETQTMEGFLSSPISEAGQQFVRSGSCAVPAPDANPQHLDTRVAQTPPPLSQAAQAAVARAEQAELHPAPLSTTSTEPIARATGHAALSAMQGPHGFAWLVPGKIAGTPLPGIVHALEHDFAALKRMGVTTLITLTERDLPQPALQAAGLRNLHLPIYDRESPTVAQIQMLLRRMEMLLEKDQVLAVHCLAGLGRTGTVLAAWLIREGLTATEALRRVRLINADYVQSSEQESFLTQYEETILRKIV